MTRQVLPELRQKIEAEHIDMLFSAGARNEEMGGDKPREAVFHFMECVWIADELDEFLVG